MAKTRYRKQTRRLRTRKYKKGGAHTPPRPTSAQLKNTYKKRHWNSRPAALDIHKTPTSSEKRRKESEEKKKEFEERSKSGAAFPSMKSWRETRSNLQEKFNRLFKTKK